MPIEETRITPAAFPIDAVLLIDGDNDPHLPADFVLTNRTLVRVFLRTGAKIPRALERRLSPLPECIAVVSPGGGSNAADFVMAFHAGLLHSALPLQIPFTLVTADKSLSVMTLELQRVGRRALHWTSHPERGSRRRATAASSAAPALRRRTARTHVVPSPAASPAPTSAPSGAVPAAASYAERLRRMKNPPSRLKALLNDIRNRAGRPGQTPENILEELRRTGVLSLDASGRVQIQRH